MTEPISPPLRYSFAAPILAFGPGLVPIFRLAGETEISNEVRILGICFCLSLASAIALGLGRFAYALVLPAMQADLSWTFAEAGALNSANAFGHLAGALLAIWAIPRWRAERTIIGGALATSFAIGATPLFPSFEPLLALRFIAGLTGALSFVAGGTLAARAASDLGPRASLGVGVFYGGPGVGIVLSAAIVPGLIDDFAANWPFAWYGMGVASILMTVLVLLAARNVPSETPSENKIEGGTVSLFPALTGYLLYAAGYVGYITFIVANVREQGGSTTEAAFWWAGLGFGGIVAGGLWAGILRSETGRGLAFLTALTGIASTIPLLGWGSVGFGLSFILFGATFLSVVAATTNLVRLARPPEAWGPWIAYFTIAFGVGQTLGPIISGIAADMVASTDGVLWVSALLLFAGAACSLLQLRVRSP